jgi:hypothetical protein
MSDPRATDPRRRPYRDGATIRTTAEGPADRDGAWITLWTWLAAIASAAVILGLVFGHSGSGLVHNLPGEPATIGAEPSAPADDE